jgi:hypothetical protein
MELHRHVLRVLRVPPGGGRASPSERAAAQESVGATGFAADFMAWRRSAMLLAAAVVLVAAVVRSGHLLLYWETYEHHHTALGVVLMGVVMHGLVPWGTFVAVVLGLRRWTHLSGSRRWLVVAAALEIVPTFLLALIPPDWMLRPVQQDLVLVGMIAALRLSDAAMLSSRLLGVLSAGFRSATAARYLLPESPLPGAIMTTLIPMNLGTSIVFFVLLNSFVQGWLLTVGFIAFIVFELSYLVVGRRLIRGCLPEELPAVFRVVGVSRLVFLPAAAIMIVLFLFTSMNSLGAPLLTVQRLEHVWLTGVTFLVNYFVTLAAGTDLLVRGAAGLAPVDDPEATVVRRRFEAKASELAAVRHR